MARIKLGSGIESTVVNDIAPEQKAEVAYQETIKMLELNKRIEELGASIKFLENREPQVIVKEKPIYNTIVDSKEIDLSKINDINNQEFNLINNRIDEILENQQNDSNKVNDLINKQDKNTQRFYVFRDHIVNNKKELDKKIEDVQKESREFWNAMHSTTEKISNKTYNLKKQLKTQKIINILLAVGFIISLFR